MKHGDVTGLSGTSASSLRGLRRDGEGKRQEDALIMMLIL